MRGKCRNLRFTRKFSSGSRVGAFGIHQTFIQHASNIPQTSIEHSSFWLEEEEVRGRSAGRHVDDAAGPLGEVDRRPAPELRARRVDLSPLLEPSLPVLEILWSGDRLEILWKGDG